MLVSLYLGAVLIGIDKGGIPGFGALAMTIALGASTTTSSSSLSSSSHIDPRHILAIFAPVLMLADLGALYAYRKDMDIHVIQMIGIPIVVGMIVAFFFLGGQDESTIRRTTGFALLLLSIIAFVGRQIKSRLSKATFLPHANADGHEDSDKVHSFCSSSYWSILFVIVIGFLTGLLTVIANVAGPIIAIFLIKWQLPKRRLNGTRALLFLLVNFVKIPAQYYYGNISASDWWLVAPLSFTAIVSTLLTEALVMPYVDQSRFELLTWLLVAFGALKLIAH